MRKIALGLIFAAFSTSAMAEPVVGAANLVAGGAAPGAGVAVGVGSVAATNAALIAAGIAVAGGVAAGSKTETATTHQ